LRSTRLAARITASMSESTREGSNCSQAMSSGDQWPFLFVILGPYCFHNFTRAAGLVGRFWRRSARAYGSKGDNPTCTCDPA
jgi:hypothetical protein